MDVINKPNIIVITGPTATGKSIVGTLLAKKIGGEVVSADSMQIYKFMDIGTAKPSIKELQNVPHHMLDIVPPFENYSVARYVEDASKCIDNILHRGKIPVLVGGTGLYIDSLLSGRTFSAPCAKELRNALEDEYDTIGADAMLSKLRNYDAKSAEKLHANDKKRIVRALETFLSSGKTISQHDEESKNVPPRYNAYMFALNYLNRDVLYTIIDNRIDEMINNGLEDEVRSLLDMGLSRTNSSMQAIGYKEIASAIQNGTDINVAIKNVKMESRRYAKRQLTWLRRNKNIKWISRECVSDPEKCLKLILNELNWDNSFKSFHSFYQEDVTQNEA